MKPDEDDWFTNFSSFESSPEIMDILDAAVNATVGTKTEATVDSTIETTVLVEQLPEEPSTPAFALERDLSLLCNFDSGDSVTPFEEIEEEFWKLSVQRKHDEPTEPIATPICNGIPINPDAPPYPQGVKEGLKRPPYPPNNSWNPRWGPDVATGDGKAVLTFAQQLRDQSRQSGRSLEGSPTPVKAPRLITVSPTSKPQRRQEAFKKHPRADESWYQSHDSGIRLLEDDQDLESPSQGMPRQYPVSPPTAEQSSYVIDPPSFHRDRSRVPKALSLTSSHATPSPERQKQYTIFPSPTRESPNVQWNKPPPVYNSPSPRGQKTHSKESDWLSDDDDMWPIITHEPQDQVVLGLQPQSVQEPQSSPPVTNVSPLDEDPPLLYPVGQVPESYGHARTVSSSTGISVSSGRDRLRFPSRESSQRVRTTSHTSYDTWLSGRTESPTAPEPLSPQYEHTITNWGPTNSPMCIPEVTLPPVNQQYARFNDPTSIQNLYETVISPTSKIIPQRSMPNLKGAPPVGTKSSPPPVPQRSLSVTRITSPPMGHRISRSYSRGSNLSNFNPPRGSISDRPFLLPEISSTPVPEKPYKSVREETPLVTILDPFAMEVPKRIPAKLVKKKSGHMFNMWGKKKDGRGTAAVAAY
jgi:hypothetical protein